ncbi:MAG: acyl-CoA/acyl-ACP dehydrogenase, partial [Chloroflexi bacterium]|nr:acyl-CoA/acyl-ACP dehydrogenase [Chloroflexota bacterium]
EDVVIPADCLVGLPFQGWEIVQTILESERGGYTAHGNDDETAMSIQRFLKEERERS